MSSTLFDSLQLVVQTTSVQAADEIALAAQRVFQKYAQSPDAARAALLRNIAANIEALGDDLLQVVHQETALPLARVTSERGRTCAQLRMFADQAESGAWRQTVAVPADPKREPIPRPKLQLQQRAIGPVLVFGASNFPLAFSIAGGDTASALAVGCPVIAKAHPAHPKTCALIERAVQSALTNLGLPSGIFQVFYETGIEIGARMLAHPAVAAGAFTGSQAGGLALLKIAQNRPRPIPFFAEMGSVNPLIIYPQMQSERQEALLAGLHQSITMGVGQFCTRPGLVFGFGDAFARFAQLLGERFSTSAAGTMLSSDISQRYRKATAEREAEPGVRVLARGEPAEVIRQAPAVLHLTSASNFLAQITNAQRQSNLHHEIFGPTCLLVVVQSQAELDACIAELDGQLTATLWCTDSERQNLDALLFALENRAGRIIFNGFPTGVEVGAATMHGGPFPASSDARFSSVGAIASARFVRPICHQEPI